ncbi:RseA family anti-sigma factor [Burkholderia sp. L27(2015)]|uniref:RseA family anti-sigma factor n=1 Tax=Burkholderia sp. L27(2015) TaxID=1641858 RepID=UPI00131B0C14|nr:RseA family anti-sigma factor [Burkholderia sp. L27(2015)]
MGSVSMQSLAPSRAERLSAFVDGNAPVGVDLDQEVKQFLSEFSDSDRTLWSEYHLVGDVLKSDDLAADPAADSAFLKRFSAVFESEPPLLSPAAHVPVAQAPGRLAALTRRFLPPLAVAAAAATLTWVLVPQIQGNSAASAPVAAMQTASVDVRATNAANTGVQRVAMAASSGAGADLSNTALANPAAATSAPDVNMIRDARLDQYLDAHQEFAQRPVPPSAPFVRNVSAQEGH